MRVAYRELQAIARDSRQPPVIRAIARATAVLQHRMLLMMTTGADREVDAGGYLQDTIDTAARTSIALIESIDPLDTQPLTNGN